jgi:hypothetical protein
MSNTHDESLDMNRCERVPLQLSQNPIAPL